MRRESPLDVLSRAASIVQNEEKAGINMRNQLKTGQLPKGIVFSDGMEVPTKEIYRKSQIVSKSSQESKFMNSKLCELPVLTASYISKSQNINEHCKLPPPYHLHKLYEPNNYTEYSKSKSLITSPRYYPYQHHISTKDFERPSVDDHFRKSLGDQYLTSKNSYVIENDKPCSVDEHFAKALGKKWKLENEKSI